MLGEWKKKKSSPEATCKGRAVDRLSNILLPAFYWLFFPGVGVGCKLGIVDVQASLGLPYRGFERIPPFVSLWLPALMYRARKTEPRGGLSKLPGHTLILTRESTSSWMSVGSHWLSLRVCCAAAPWVRCLGGGWAGRGSRIGSAARTWGPRRNLWCCACP